MKLLDKILTSAAIVLIAGGTFMANAATPQDKATVASAAQDSSAIVSSSASSKEVVSSVDDSLKQIQQATDSAVAAINKAGQQAIDNVNSAANDDAVPSNLSVKRNGFSVIDINNGCRPVFPGEPDYQKCKDELSAYGNDAGTCSPENSKACQAAKADYIAKHSADTQAPAK